MKQKPITMEYQDFINKISAVINESRLPAFVIKHVLRDVLHDVEILERQQAADDVIKYQEQEEAPDGNG